MQSRTRRTFAIPDVIINIRRKSYFVSQNVSKMFFKSIETIVKLFFLDGHTSDASANTQNLTVDSKNIFHSVKNFKMRSFFLVRIFLYSVRIQENTDQKKLRIWTVFSRSVLLGHEISRKEASNELKQLSLLRDTNNRCERRTWYKCVKKKTYFLKYSI